MVGACVCSRPDVRSRLAEAMRRLSARDSNSIPRAASGAACQNSEPMEAQVLLPVHTIDQSRMRKRDARSLLRMARFRRSWLRPDGVQIHRGRWAVLSPADRSLIQDGEADLHFGILYARVVSAGRGSRRLSLLRALRQTTTGPETAE